MRLRFTASVTFVLIATLSGAAIRAEGTEIHDRIKSGLPPKPESEDKSSDTPPPRKPLPGLITASSSPLLSFPSGKRKAAKGQNIRIYQLDDDEESAEVFVTLKKPSTWPTKIKVYAVTDAKAIPFVNESKEALDLSALTPIFEKEDFSGDAPFSQLLKSESKGRVIIVSFEDLPLPKASDAGGGTKKKDPWRHYDRLRSLTTK